jgi:hypothetical protein
MSSNLVKNWVNEPALIKKAAEIGIHEYLSEKELNEAFTFATMALRGDLTDEAIEKMTEGGEGAQIVLSWLVSRLPRIHCDQNRTPKTIQSPDLF